MIKQSTIYFDLPIHEANVEVDVEDGVGVPVEMDGKWLFMVSAPGSM